MAQENTKFLTVQLLVPYAKVEVEDVEVPVDASDNEILDLAVEELRDELHRANLGSVTNPYN